MGGSWGDGDRGAQARVSLSPRANTQPADADAGSLGDVHRDLVRIRQRIAPWKVSPLRVTFEPDDQIGALYDSNGRIDRGIDLDRRDLVEGARDALPGVTAGH